MGTILERMLATSRQYSDSHMLSVQRQKTGKRCGFSRACFAQDLFRKVAC